MYKPLSESYFINAKTCAAVTELCSRLSTRSFYQQDLIFPQLEDRFANSEEIQAVQRGQSAGRAEGDRQRSVDQQVQHEAQHPGQDPERLDEEVEHQVSVHPSLSQQGEAGEVSQSGGGPGELRQQW